MNICLLQRRGTQHSRKSETRKQGHEAEDQQAEACDEEDPLPPPGVFWKPTPVEIENVRRHESEGTPCHRISGPEVRTEVSRERPLTVRETSSASIGEGNALVDVVEELVPGLT